MTYLFFGAAILLTIASVVCKSDESLSIKLNSDSNMLLILAAMSYLADKLGV